MNNLNGVSKLKIAMTKVIEYLVGGVFAVIIAVIALLTVSNPSESLPFPGSTWSAVGSAAIQPDWSDSAKLHLAAVGMAVYAGDAPRIDVEIRVGQTTIASNLESSADQVKSKYCMMTSEPPLKERPTGTRILTQVVCVVPLSEISSSDSLVPISVLMTLRGNSKSQNTPLVASGTYAIKGGILHRLFTL